MHTNSKDQTQLIPPFQEAIDSLCTIIKKVNQLSEKTIVAPFPSPWFEIKYLIENLVQKLKNTFVPQPELSSSNLSALKDVIEIVFLNKHSFTDQFNAMYTLQFNVKNPFYDDLNSIKKKLSYDVPLQILTVAATKNNLKGNSECKNLLPKMLNHTNRLCRSQNVKHVSDEIQLLFYAQSAILDNFEFLQSCTKDDFLKFQFALPNGNKGTVEQAIDLLPISAFCRYGSVFSEQSNAKTEVSGKFTPHLP